MTVRVCATPGCPTKIKAGSRSGRCPDCERTADKARGTRQERGYDAAYDARRRDDLARLARGEVLICWRCTRAVSASDYSLGHCDDDRTVIHGPEHLRRCNLANTRGGCTHPDHSP